MPKVNMDTTLTGLDGTTALRNEEDKVVKLRMIAIACLLANRPCSPEEKLADFDMAERLHKDKSGTVDLSIEEVAHLKKRIGESQGPLVVKRCWDVLDPRGKED